VSGPLALTDTDAGGPATGRPNGPVVEVTPARSALVGGTEVRRSLPRRGRRTVGPWCFLDHLGPVVVGGAGGGVAASIGPHPHMGLHTVTWLLAGQLVHTDSLGSEQGIRPGQVNLMTAGAGVAHAEDGRAQHSGEVHGVQLWVAQPEGTRFGPARFEHFPDVPAVDLGRATAVVIAGELGGVVSPARLDTPGTGAELRGDGPFAVPLDPTHEHAIVVLSGAAELDGRRLAPDELVYLGDGRDELRLVALGPTRLLLLGGAPFGEELLMWWNFVARHRAEIEQACTDWEGGSPRFGEVASGLDRIPAPRPSWLPR
jgi:redox-sensitive bicupin YhaK (pirin superfamily)